MRGLDHDAYYRAGVGVLACGAASTRAYVLAMLRHWSTEGADGFVFANAENLVQGERGSWEGARGAAAVGLAWRAWSSCGSEAQTATTHPL